MDSEVTSRKFNNGYDYPLLGLGTWKSAPGEVVQAVKDAIDIGYRHFDCASIYGNEAQVGEAIKEKIEEGVVQREDLFVTSKLWSTEHTQDLVVPAIKKSLENLQLDYLDLYLMHWPMGFKEGGELFPFDENNKLIGSDVHFTETWAGMEECVNLGLARSIGISNFNHLQIEELLAKANIKPVNNQVECHPYFNQQQLIDYCEERNITVTAYSPFGSPDRPDIMKDSPTDPLLLEDPVIMAIGEKYNKTSAQILIRYQIQRGVSVIPKTVTKSRIHSNFEVFDFTISDEDMEALHKLNTNERKLKFLLTDQHKYFPFNEEY